MGNLFQGSVFLETGEILLCGLVNKILLLQNQGLSLTNLKFICIDLRGYRFLAINQIRVSNFNLIDLPSNINAGIVFEYFLVSA